MRLKSSAVIVRLAIVSLVALAAVSPCTQQAEAAPPAPAVTTPRQLVTDPMTWLVPTATGWQPAEHAQPTLWIEGQPVTRYSVDKPGVERAFTLFGKER